METACDLFHRCVARSSDDDWYQLTRCYGPVVRNMFRQALARHGLKKSNQDLEEYVQELYLRLLTTRRGQFRGRTDSELWKYLGRIAQNLVIDQWRALDSQRNLMAEESLSCSWCLAASAESPEERAMTRQSFVLFLNDCRWAARGYQVELKVRVMGLAYLHGCSSREIARRLPDPMTPQQIDAMLFRLRRHLARRGFKISHRGRGGLYPSIDRTQ